MHDFIELETGADCEASFIFLHGLGVDGADMAPIARQLCSEEQLSIRFCLPHAPKRTVSLDNGRVTRAWYDTTSFSSDGQINLAHLRECERILDGLIRRELDRGVAPERILLGGFSQGGVASLHGGLRYGLPLGGVAVLSGHLAAADLLPLEAPAANAQVPIFMAHGREDPLITHAMAANSRRRLQELGYQVTWHDYAMGHSVCRQEIRDLTSWISATLRANAGLQAQLS